MILKSWMHRILTRTLLSLGVLLLWEGSEVRSSEVAFSFVISGRWSASTGL